MSETRVAFYRYRGSTGDWEYRVHGIVSDGQGISEDELEELANDLLHRMGYRRVYVEEVNNPPLDWLRKQVESNRRNAKYYMELANRLAGLVEQREDAELAEWEAGRMVEWCVTHNCEIGVCDPLGNDRSKCKAEVRIVDEPGGNSETAPVEAG